MKQLDKKSSDHHSLLDSYVTRRSLKLIDILSTQSQKQAKAFLSKPSALWPLDPIFQSMKANVRLLKGVNDWAEPGVTLIQSYNDVVTEDVSQKQYLLQHVSSHRTMFAVPTKDAPKKMK